MQPGGDEPRRAEFWTVGNHGNFLLNTNTLQSTVITQNWGAGTLTVPYGVRKNDDIMNYFVKKPGIAWHYNYSHNREDSAFSSIRTGDTLTIYAVGTTLLTKKFALIAAPPGPDAKVVIPKNYFNPGTNSWQSGGPFQVTMNSAGIDTIMGFIGGGNPWGLPFATRVDTLIKYLEKPSNASWEFIWVDGKQRADLKNGDKLKITAQNGTTKEYFIKVADYLPNHNAQLSSITWPDIPADYFDVPPWNSDTIPDFQPAKYDYTLEVPLGVEGIPALMSTPVALNTKIEVTRATSLDGSPAARSIVFNTTAQDDTTLLKYTILLTKLDETLKLTTYRQSKLTTFRRSF